MRKGFSWPAGAFLLGIVSLTLISLVGRSVDLGPSWWDVALNLQVHGNYLVRGEGTAISGDFAYRARWQGTMERDEDDFRLFHKDAKNLLWEVREQVQGPQAVHVFSEKDVPEEPQFTMNYILKNDNLLDFYFLVDGIPIPLSATSSKFDLVLPCSSEPLSSQSAFFYNAHVFKGSNRITIPEVEIARKSFEKSFTWEWLCHQWMHIEDNLSFISNRHQAEVTVSLVPRF